MCRTLDQRWHSNRYGYGEKYKSGAKNHQTPISYIALIIYAFSRLMMERMVLNYGKVMAQQPVTVW